MDKFNQKFSSFLYKFFFPACAFFALITLGFFIVSDLANPNQTVVEHFHFKKVIFFFVFSCVLALANRLLYSRGLSVFVRLILHFFITAITLFILLIADDYAADNGGKKLLVFMVVYLFVYIFTAFIVYIFRKTTGYGKDAEKEKKSGYKKQF